MFCFYLLTCQTLRSKFYTFSIHILPPIVHIEIALHLYIVGLYDVSTTMSFTKKFFLQPLVIRDTYTIFESIIYRHFDEGSLIISVLTFLYQRWLGKDRSTEVLEFVISTMVVLPNYSSALFLDSAFNSATCSNNLHSLTPNYATKPPGVRPKASATMFVFLGW